MADKLKLYKPISPFTLLQAFGEDLTCVDSATKKICKTRSDGQACPSGYESLYQSVGLKGHDGLDVTAWLGQPVYSAIDGVVMEIHTDRERGLGVDIVSSSKFTFDRTPHSEAGECFAKTRYWHLDRVESLSIGQSIRVGERIGWAGKTGNASGYHLHFELKLVNQGLSGEYFNIFQNNSYYGAIDPYPFMQELAAFEMNSWLTRQKYIFADWMRKPRSTS